jgi:MFS superfamily sulfate permease-like transporter
MTEQFPPPPPPGQPEPVPGQPVPGQPVPGQPVPGQPPYPAMDKKSNGCLKAFLITLAVVVVLGVIGAVLVAVVGVSVFNTVTAPVDSTNEYLQALQDERFDDAWSSTCVAFQESNPKEEFRAQIAGALQERGGIDKINASGSEIETANGESVARVTYTLTFGNGQTIDNEAELVKEGGEWKFCGADS